MNTQTKNIAENIIDWFDNYASVYEFDSRAQFEDFTLSDLEKVNIEQAWELIAPKLKNLVKDYIECEIEDRINE